jgi:hypothetical protein
MVKRADWLSVTPEPERELPEAIATLARGGIPSAAEIAGEAGRIERLILRGSQRMWRAYLRDVAGLIERNAGVADPAVVRARERASAVISNHDNLMLALR